jgi:cell division protein FtsB
LLLVVVFSDNGWLELRRMRAAHVRLLQENDRLNQDNQRMYRSIERMQKDPEFMENVARRELGMIRGDELIFTFKRDKKETIMMPAPEHYTAAMAKLYADQGYLRKAAEIYRHMAGLQPERQDLREELERIEQRIVASRAPTRKDIELLLREWMGMVKDNNGKRNRP